MRAALRRGLEAFGPLGRALLAWRTRGQAEALLDGRGWRAAGAALAASLDDRVAEGPFRGMHYPRRRGDIVHTAKLLGAYEAELHDALEELIARAPARVIDVGSGDGYYAVGLARRLPEATHLAVDPDPLAQRSCAETARLNGVADRLAHRPLLDPPALQHTLGSRALLIVDCEGYEAVLLDPVQVPALRTTDIIVETHDFAVAGVTDDLARRFATTHAVERLAPTPRSVEDYPMLERLPSDQARGLLDEFRHTPQGWLILRANR